MGRTRTYSWSDPRELDKMGRDMAGLDFIRLLVSDGLGRTPMMATLGFSIVAADDGYVEIECVVEEFVYNPIGVVHGGLAATLLDSAAASAIHTTLPAGTGYTTADLSVHYLRPITTGLGPIRAIGTVINRGRRTTVPRHSNQQDGRCASLFHNNPQAIPETDVSYLFMIALWRSCW